MKKNLSLAVNILAALPDDRDSVNKSHVKEIQNMLKLENSEIPINEVTFAMHRYNHYL